MSEISREKAIKDIQENVLPCVGGKSLRIAISDMQKLEKIKQILFNGDYCMHDTLVRIEQIVKEV